MLSQNRGECDACNYEQAFQTTLLLPSITMRDAHFGQGQVEQSRESGCGNSLS